MTDGPKTWGEMTPEEKGALLLAQHEGKVIEWCPDGYWTKACALQDPYRYRIKPEPRRETVTLLTAAYYSWVADPEHNCGERNTHRIIFDVIDGEPDCASVHMEKIQ
jgi:hypothetical protein